MSKNNIKLSEKNKKEISEDKKKRFKAFDEVFCDGVMLHWDEEEQRFELSEIHYEGVIYKDGEEIIVEYDDDGKGYYINEWGNDDN